MLRSDCTKIEYLVSQEIDTILAFVRVNRIIRGAGRVAQE